MTAITAVADPVRTIVHLTNAVGASRAVQVIAELGVADVIGPDEQVAVGVLAERAACHPDALHRVLRSLAHIATCAEVRSPRSWARSASSAVTINAFSSLITPVRARTAAVLVIAWTRIASRTP